MKLKKTAIASFSIMIVLIVIIIQNHLKPIVLQNNLDIEGMGETTLSQPIFGSENLLIVFADAANFPGHDLGKKLAGSGMTVITVDSTKFLNQFNQQTGVCLDSQQISQNIEILKQKWSKSLTQPSIIAGIGDGALIPFMNAESNLRSDTTNLSVGFSVNLPNGLTLCPSYTVVSDNQQLKLVSSPKLTSEWHTIWADQPPAETGVFIRKLEKVDSIIGNYDTTADNLLNQEINLIVNKSQSSNQPLPVVELPTAKPSDTVTIFYSGDGGWRDLDRSVAKVMVEQNYPVVGVDVLRYFWAYKTPEQVARDLSVTMAYYRKEWHTKSFVLAGYSFGADILPAIYNLLPQQDRDNVILLTLVALGKQADFEIHVSGWLGQKSHGQDLTSDLLKIPAGKLLCIYGKEEQTETACTSLQNSQDASILELPGGHHFDEDYPKLTGKILGVYKSHGIS